MKFFSELSNRISEKLISEKDCMISNDRGLSETFKGHFINITFSLQREEWQFKFNSVIQNEVRKVISTWMK